MEAGLHITSLGLGLISAAACWHVWQNGYVEFWRYPISSGTQRLLNAGGVVLFGGAAMTFLAGGLDF